MALYKTCHTLTHVVPSVGFTQNLSVGCLKLWETGGGEGEAERDQENFKVN